MPKPPVLLQAVPTVATGIRNDPDAWASGVLVGGSILAKWLSYAEHVEFLVSLREENFRMIFEVWSGIGWWFIGAAGIVWFLNRFSKRGSPHSTSPSWGLVASCALIAFIFGSLIAVQSFGGIPQVISSQTVGYTVGPSGVATTEPCVATVDGTPLLTFKADFKLALVCVRPDPTKDILSDPHIFVSNLFEISSGPIAIEATKSPAGDFTDQGQGALTINHFAVLVPREVHWEKLTTLSDIMALGGKILDQKYYK
jgi:hypothetical protein